ncbi:histidinol-phosphate transaminase [Ravibacter arvi]|uniref:Histidinol-phosphate aminotransferase n=1 Tax=Ravibacter arvi TaxID=2051041 RepID=A0ABP8LUV3_9BACT
MNKNFDLSRVLRPHILNLTPYSSARDEYTGKEGVFLDANENPIGSATHAPFNRYPDPYQQEIKQLLAPVKGVAPEQIFLGNGSDEAIDLLIRATCRPGSDNLIILPPTYGMYEVSANINDVEVRKVSLTEDFQIRPEAILAQTDAHTKIIWVCSPNNPTGNSIDGDAIRKLLDEFDGLVVVDEAYIDFTAQPSWTNELVNYPNLVVIQTFSKAWGLASLRTGMGFASVALIAVLNKIKPPYNIGGPSQLLLLEALRNKDVVPAMIAEILAQREALASSLTALPIVQKVYPSDANFLLVRFNDAKATMNYLVDEKIIVRDRSKVTLCEGCLRITVGTAAENESLLQSLRELAGA